MKRNFTILLMILVAFGGFVNAQIPTDGLVGHWSFTGNALDESGNGNDGTVTGATLTTDRFGNENSAYSFDGVDDYIEVNNTVINNTLTNNQDYTISVWIQTTELGEWMQEDPVIIALRDIDLSWSDKVIVLSIDDAGYITSSFGEHDLTQFHTITSNIIGNDNIWHNIVHIHQNDSNYLYFDNNLMGTTVDVGEQTTTTSSLTLGTRYNDAGTTFSSSYFSGSIDDVLVYNKALTQSEITAIYEEPAPPCLVASYPFTGSAVDISGNDNNGVVNGATLTEDRFGTPNSAYSFDGVDDKIVVPHSSSFETSDWTVTAWYKTEFQGYNRITDKSCTSNINYMSIILLDGKVYGSTSVGGVQNDPLPTDTANTADGNWHFTAYSRSNGYYNLYVDGVLVSSVVDDFTNIVNTDSLTIGSPCDYPSQQFNGSLDDIKIYGCALDSTEIADLYYDGQCFETITTEVFDTTFVTVEDTLNIDLIITELVAPDNMNEMLVYPNPTSDLVYINCGDFSKMDSYQLKLVNSLSQVMWSTTVTQQEYSVDLAGYTTGIYFLEIYNSTAQKIEVKKIVLR